MMFKYWAAAVAQWIALAMVNGLWVQEGHPTTIAPVLHRKISPKIR